MHLNHCSWGISAKMNVFKKCIYIYIYIRLYIEGERNKEALNPLLVPQLAPHEVFNKGIQGSKSSFSIVIIE